MAAETVLLGNTSLDNNQNHKMTGRVITNSKGLELKTYTILLKNYVIKCKNLELSYTSSVIYVISVINQKVENWIILFSVKYSFFQETETLDDSKKCQ